MSVRHEIIDDFDKDVIPVGSFYFHVDAQPINPGPSNLYQSRDYINSANVLTYIEAFAHTHRFTVDRRKA